MTTKEQEKKALEQIKKIVASLGEDSYLAMAFEGAFEDAADNIEYDMACSWKQRAEIAKNDASTYKKQRDEMANKALYLSKDIATADAALEKTSAKLTVAEETIETLTAEKESMREEASALREVIDDLKADVSIRDAEIIQLKARLYDLLYKG